MCRGTYTSCLHFLHHRGTLYHRSIIPKSLRHFFHGKVQFWRSLRTLDRDLAGVRSARLEYEARRLFYTLEHSTMDKAQIAALIRQWQDTALEAGEDERIINAPSRRRTSTRQIRRSPWHWKKPTRHWCPAIMIQLPVKLMNYSHAAQTPSRSITAQSRTSGWLGNCSRQRWKCFGLS